MAASIRSGGNDQAARLTVMFGVVIGVLVPLTFVGGGTLGLPVSCCTPPAASGPSAWLALTSHTQFR